MAENQQQQESNRYAHLLNDGSRSATAAAVNSRAPIVVSNKLADSTATAINPKPKQHQEPHRNLQVTGGSSATATTTTTTNRKAPPLYQQQQQQNQQQRAYYYGSFSAIDWREQWIMVKERVLEKVDEPQSQRRLILFIVCCALLLDNMLYMVIVPIIPDYLRSIGAWSTYTENAKWIRRNVSHGAPKWERIGGQVVYEGEDSAVGFLFASKAMIQLLINPFSGAIIDRIGYEIPMMIGLIVMFFSTMVFACGQTYSVLFLARSLQGVGSAFADTSGLAMIADRFTEENERQRALGIALAFISFGCLVAPPFGSVLYEAAGKEVPFIILSLVCLIDGSLLLLVTPPGTFAQLLPNYNYNNYAMQQRAASSYQSAQPAGNNRTQRQVQQQQQQSNQKQEVAVQMQQNQQQQTEQQQQSGKPKPPSLQRQKSISRRHSMTLASQGEAPRGTPIYVLFRDPCIACCAGALVVANVSLAFLEPTISIWVQNTMPDIEEWQMGMIWLPAFGPHVLGVYLTVRLADKYPRYQWLIAAIGLVLEGVSCLMVPFCTSFWSLIIPISIICFGIALIDTAILPTLGFLVDTRYVSVYGSIYAIADISYSLSYAVGPIIAGGIVEAIGFAALNILIAIVTLGYTPSLMMLRSIHDYEPFEADQSGLKAEQEKPFGQYGRKPICSAAEDDVYQEEQEEEDDISYDDDEAGHRMSGYYTAAGKKHQQQQQHTSDNYRQQQSYNSSNSYNQTSAATKYESPKWANSSVAAAGTGSIVRGSSIKSSAANNYSNNNNSNSGGSNAATSPKTVTIAEPRWQASDGSRPEVGYGRGGTYNDDDDPTSVPSAEPAAQRWPEVAEQTQPTGTVKNPFMAD